MNLRTGYFLRGVDGTTRQVGSGSDDTMRPITGAITAVSSSAGLMTWNNAVIRNAFELMKKRQTPTEGKQQEYVSPPLKIAQDRIRRLEAENMRLKDENNRLLVQFVTWAYNAHSRGLDEDFLNRPVPKVNRGQT